MPRVSPSADAAGPRRQLRHHPQRRLAAGDALHVIVGVAQARDLIVPGGAREMRGQYYILECQQRIVWWRWLLAEHVEAGAKQLIVCERAGEFGLVDHRAAAGVDDDRFGFIEAS